MTDSRPSSPEDEDSEDLPEDGATSAEPFQTWTPPRGPLVRFVTWTIIIAFILCTAGMVAVVIASWSRGSRPGP